MGQAIPLGRKAGLETTIGGGNMERLISFLLLAVIVLGIGYAALCMAVEATLQAAPWLAVITR